MSNVETRCEQGIDAFPVWNDGLLDVLSGIGVLAIGIAWQADLVPLGAIAPTVLVPFWSWLRKHITEPRVGKIHISQQQRQKNRTLLLAAIALGIVTFVIAISLYWIVVRGEAAILSFMIAGVPAALVGLMALITAALTSSKRFIFYAFILVACGIFVVTFDLGPGWALIGGGLLVVVSGIIVIVRFLNEYPKV